MIILRQNQYSNKEYINPEILKNRGPKDKYRALDYEIASALHNFDRKGSIDSNPGYEAIELAKYLDEGTGEQLYENYVLTRLAENKLPFSL